MENLQELKGDRHHHHHRHHHPTTRLTRQREHISAASFPEASISRTVENLQAPPPPSPPPPCETDVPTLTDLRSMIPSQPASAGGEPPGTEVHPGDPKVLEGAVGEGVRGQVQHVGELLQVLQLRLHVVQHVLVLLAAPRQLQLVDVAADRQQLSGQQLVLGTHLQLWIQIYTEKAKG